MLVRKRLEVDFVCNCGSQRYYIQSAFAIPLREKMVQEKKSLARRLRKPSIRGLSQGKIDIPTAMKGLLTNLRETGLRHCCKTTNFKSTAQFTVYNALTAAQSASLNFPAYVLYFHYIILTINAASGIYQLSFSFYRDTFLLSVS